MPRPSVSVLIVEVQNSESPCIYIAKGALYRAQTISSSEVSSISSEADVESTVNSVT